MGLEPTMFTCRILNLVRTESSYRNTPSILHNDLSLSVMKRTTQPMETVVQSVLQLWRVSSKV